MIIFKTFAKNGFYASIKTMITLNAQKRSKTDKLESLRSNGMVPAVVYGAGVENTPISVQMSEFKKVYKEAGETTTISLVLDGKTIPVMIHDLQRHPVKDTAQHVDFLAVDLAKTIEAEIPLVFTGVSNAVKAGGVLVKVMHEVTVSALPANMPHELTVDISKLVTLEDNVYVKDITLPANVTMVSDAGDVIAAVTPATEEKEESPIDLSKIEVEKKGKKEDAQ